MRGEIEYEYEYRFAEYEWEKERSVRVRWAVVLWVVGLVTRGFGETSASLEEAFAGFEKSPAFDERVSSYTLNPGIHVHINAPGAAKLDPAKPTRIAFYALPNGNTTSQTVGKRLAPGVDWHYAIQHIGAQTRRLRELVPEENLLTVYLEADKRSWPTWRKEHPDSVIGETIRSFVTRFSALNPTVELAGHSGGGSLIFGFINSSPKLPDWLGRILFIDATYAYDDSLGHGDKLVEWLKGGADRSLCAICYDDREVKLDGKPIVSATGGTFRKTGLMRDRLQKSFDLQKIEQGDVHRWRGLNGRIELIFHLNPERKILHTVLVEKNGFVYGSLCGSRYETRSDPFYGAAGYERWIGE